MPTLDPSPPLSKLLDQDRRYTLDAYRFGLEALTFPQETLGFGQEPAAEEIEHGRRPGYCRTKKAARSMPSGPPA